MAFGDTPILEQFEGAAAGPPNANWSVWPTTAVHIRRDGGGLCDSNDATGFGGDWWNPSTFGPDCECGITVVTLPTTTGKSIRLELGLIDSPGAATRDGYSLLFTWNSGSADSWTLQIITNNAYSALGATVSQDIVAGDKIGMERIGSTIKAYRFTGGAWAEIVSRSNATHGGAGAIGLVAQSQEWALDDFFGGTVEAEVTQRIFASHYYQWE